MVYAGNMITGVVPARRSNKEKIMPKDKKMMPKSPTYSPHSTKGGKMRRGLDVKQGSSLPKNPKGGKKK